MRVAVEHAIDRAVDQMVPSFLEYVCTIIDHTENEAIKFALECMPSTLDRALDWIVSCTLKRIGHLYEHDSYTETDSGRTHAHHNPGGTFWIYSPPLKTETSP